MRTSSCLSAASPDNGNLNQRPPQPRQELPTKEEILEMARCVSDRTRILRLKRHTEKLKERNRELQKRMITSYEINRRVGWLNERLLLKIRRLEERLNGAENKIAEYRAGWPRYSFGKKQSMPPLAHKYPSALVVSGD